MHQYFFLHTSGFHKEDILNWAQAGFCFMLLMRMITAYSVIAVHQRPLFSLMLDINRSVRTRQALTGYSHTACSAFKWKIERAGTSMCKLEEGGTYGWDVPVRITDSVDMLKTETEEQAGPLRALIVSLFYVSHGCKSTSVTYLKTSLGLRSPKVQSLMRPASL